MEKNRKKLNQKAYSPHISNPNLNQNPSGSSYPVIESIKTNDAAKEGVKESQCKFKDVLSSEKSENIIYNNSFAEKLEAWKNKMPYKNLLQSNSDNDLEFENDDVMIDVMVNNHTKKIQRIISKFLIITGVILFICGSVKFIGFTNKGIIKNSYADFFQLFIDKSELIVLKSLFSILHECGRREVYDKYLIVGLMLCLIGFFSN